jgi:large conductance mechanosensitive channel
VSVCMQEMSSLNDEHDENAPLIAVVSERSGAQPNKARRLLSKIAQPVVGFWDFLVRGSFVQLATAVIVGGAFNDAVRSLINDILMPPVGALLGHANLQNLYGIIQPGLGGNTSYPSLAAAQADGAVTENYGKFILATINFLVIAVIMYFVVKAGVATAASTKRLKKALLQQEVESTKECPFCINQIPVRATKCGFCCEHQPQLST